MGLDAKSLPTVILCLLAMVSPSVHATTYHVDPVNGDDTSNGSAAEPWRTIQRAMVDSASTPRVTSGDTVLLCSGKYGEASFASIQSPAPTSWDDRILYAAEKGATPVFSSLSINTASGKGYLEFSGIRIDRSDVNDDSNSHAVYIKNCSHIRLRKCTIHGNGTVDKDGGKWTRTGVLIRATDARQHTDDIVIEGCGVSGVVAGVDTAGAGSREGLVLRDSYIHFIAGSNVKLHGETVKPILIAGNVFANKFLPPNSSFHGSGIACRARPVTIQGNIFRDCGGTSNLTFYWYVYDGAVIVTGALSDPKTEFIEDETVVQVDTNASGVVAEVRSGRAERILRDQEVNAFVSGKNLVGKISGAVLTNVVVASVRKYGGYRNMIIENNLNYDSRNISNMRLTDLGDNCVFRNNTVIGRWHDLNPAKPRSRYFGVGTINFAHGTDPSTFKMHNNILVGELGIENTRDIDEDYNIIWALRGKGGKMVNAMTGAHTQICVINTNTLTTPIDYFEASGGFFIGGKDFDAHSFQHPEDAQHRFGQVHNQDLSHCYALAKGSDAVGFADVKNAPKADIRGATRDASPDCGCYERVVAISRDAKGDGDVNGGGSALQTRTSGPGCGPAPAIVQLERHTGEE